MKIETMKITIGLFGAVQPVSCAIALIVGMIVSPVAYPAVAVMAVVVSWLVASFWVLRGAIVIMREIEGIAQPPHPTAIAEKRVIPVWSMGKKSEIEL